MEAKAKAKEDKEARAKASQKRKRKAEQTFEQREAKKAYDRREARSVERIVPNDHRSSNAVDDAMQTQRTTRNNATRTLRATVARRARARIDMTARACPGGGWTVIGIWLTEAREPSDTEG